MAAPVPNITGGAATSGDVRSSVGVDFGPVSVGGLFGSSSSARASDSSGLLMPALIVAGAVIAFLVFQRRK